MSGTLSDSIDACAVAVRTADYDRYLSALFAPREARGSLLALYAFNYEVAKTAEVVSDPTLGLIRLQWWRDVIEEIYADKPRRHEIVPALSEAIVRHALPQPFFETLIAARENDLSPAPFETLPELEDYADATSGHLMRLAARILGAGDVLDEAIAPFGKAFAITGLLRAFPFHAAKGRIMLPWDEIAAAGLTPGEILSGRAKNIRILIECLGGIARTHIAAAGLTIPRKFLTAVLPAALVRPYLAIMDAKDFDPYRDPVELSVPRRQWAMFGALVRGRI